MSSPLPATRNKAVWDICMHKRSYYIINAVTVYRLIMAPVLIMLVVNNYFNLFRWLLVLSFLTDAVDEFFSRKYHVDSSAGARLEFAGRRPHDSRRINRRGAVLSGVYERTIDLDCRVGWYVFTTGDSCIDQVQENDEFSYTHD